MVSVGQRFRDLREITGMTLRKAAMLVNVDVAVLSKMERGERRLNKKVVIKLAELYHVDPDEILAQYLGEKVLYDLKDEVLGAKALILAEKSIQYYNYIKKDLSEVIQKTMPVFQEENRIEKVWVFGSFARRDQRAGSDLDIMIKIRKGEKFSLFDFAEIQYQLENVLGLQVDIAEEDAFNILVQETVMAERVLIYEK